MVLVVVGIRIMRTLMGRLSGQLQKHQLLVRDYSGSGTSFGFRSVSASEKSHLVRKVFDSVARSYDLMNDCMSMGLHRVWKDHFVRKLEPIAGLKVLDAAAGTGDIAFRLWRREPTVSVTLLDPNEEMLAVARARADALRISESPIDRSSAEEVATAISETEQQRCGTMHFVASTAECLPFPAASFDAYTISFGMRNTSEPLRVMQEAYRVLRPGGRFLMMEFGHVPDAFPLVQRFYDAYSFSLIPQLGAWIAQDRDAYQYLVESIRAFPKQDDVCQLMHQAGFREITFENLSFGIVSIFSGWKAHEGVAALNGAEHASGS
jgi:demethylmenaquinone methyltransferase/2-methoxy-6-polyprenyl-1,4-benzoquinol methylase